jgi:cell division topological specificity factor
MSIFNYLRRRTASASVAKERLQIIISHERLQKHSQKGEASPTYLPELQEEILAVIAKYVNISRDQVSVNLERMGDNSILELNITMPDDLPEQA